MIHHQTIRDHLALAALRFVSLRCRLLQLEVDELGILFKSGKITSEELDLKLEELEILDLAYPHIQMPECEATQ